MRWYVSRGGQTEGPFEEAEVAARAARRELEGAYVASEGSAEWLAIDQVPAFAPKRPAMPQQVMPSTQALDGAAIAAAIASHGGYTPPPTPQAYSPSPQRPYTPQPYTPQPYAPQPSAPYVPPVAMPEKKRSTGLYVGAGCAVLFVLLACAGGVGAYFVFPGDLEADVSARLGAGAHAADIEYVVHSDEEMDVRVEALWDGAGVPQTITGRTDSEGDATLRHPRTPDGAWIRATVRVTDPDDDERTITRTVELDMPPRLRESPEGLDCIARQRCTIRWGDGDNLAINGSPGIQVIHGAESATIPPVGAGMENGSASLPLSVGSYAATSDMSALFGESDLSVTFPVQVVLTPGAAPISGNMTRTGPIVRQRIAAFLGGITNGPLAIEGPGTGRAIAYLPFAGQNDIVLGASQPPPTLSDIAYIGIATWEYTTVGTCPYEGVTTRRVTHVRRSQADALVRLYDRRTGSVIAQRFFEGHPPSCPDRLPAGREFVFGAPSDAIILLWLRLNAPT